MKKIMIIPQLSLTEMGLRIKHYIKLDRDKQLDMEHKSVLLKAAIAYRDGNFDESCRYLAVLNHMDLTAENEARLALLDI